MGLEDYQNPPNKGGFFYFTGLVAKQVAREEDLNLPALRRKAPVQTLK